MTETLENYGQALCRISFIWGLSDGFLTIKTGFMDFGGRTSQRQSAPDITSYYEEHGINMTGNINLVHLVKGTVCQVSPL